MSFDKDKHLKKLLKIGELSDVSPIKEIETVKSSRSAKEVNQEDAIIKVQKINNSHIINKNNDVNPKTHSQNTNNQNDKASGKKNDKNEGNKQKNVRSKNKQALMTEQNKSELNKLKKQEIILQTNRKGEVLYCKLCCIKMNSLQVAFQHVHSLRHGRLFQIMMLKQGATMKTNLNMQINEVDNFIQRLVAEVRLDEKGMDQRKHVLSMFQKIVHDINPEAKVLLFGSTVTGCALKDSNLNISIFHSQPSSICLPLITTLKNSKIFSGLQEKLNGSQPYVSVLYDHNLKVIISFNDQCSFWTSLLLAHYAFLDNRLVPLAITLRAWAKYNGMDNERNGGLPSYVYTLLAVFFLQRPFCGLLLVLHEMVKGDGEEALKNMLKIERLKTNYDTSCGTLLVDMLRFYCFEFNSSQFVVSIRSSKPLSKKCKNWRSKYLTIEDPFLDKANVAQALNNHEIMEYIELKFLIFYTFFSNLNEQRAKSLKSSMDLLRPSMNIISCLQCFFKPLYMGEEILPRKMCSWCQETGHLKHNCTYYTTIRFELKLPSFSVLQNIDDVLQSNLKENEMTEFEYQRRLKFVHELNLRIRENKNSKKEFSKSQLNLFGSTRNGFGTIDSDLDIFMTFEDLPDIQNKSTVIRRLSGVLRKESLVCDVKAITRARVPIVKFKERKSGKECDISLYNLLGFENTRLLASYASFDKRTLLLGHAFKKLAKAGHIADASCGSLSSYAYVLMVIYFLQHTSPPVLPCLQEYHEGEKPVKYIEGVNAWYCLDVEKIKEEMQENTSSAAKLWCDMMNFYTASFNFDDLVISIRQLDPLYKIDKGWGKSNIAIEDPFNLDHNLGAGVSDKMALFIIRFLDEAKFSFWQGKDLENLFCEAFYLNNHPSSKGNVCWFCNRNGHISSDCPSKKLGRRNYETDSNNSKDDVNHDSRESLNEEENEGGLAAQNSVTVHQSEQNKRSSEDTVQKFEKTSNKNTLELVEQQTIKSLQPSIEYLSTAFEGTHLELNHNETSRQLKNFEDKTIQEFEKSQRTQKTQNNLESEFTQDCLKKSHSTKFSSNSNYRIQQREKPQQHSIKSYHDNNRKQHVSHQVYNEKSFQMMTPIKSSNSIVSVPSFEQHHFLKQKVGNMHTLMVPSQTPITQTQPNAVHTIQSSMVSPSGDVFNIHNKYLDQNKTSKNFKNFQQNRQDCQQSKQTQKNRNNKNKHNGDFKYLHHDKALNFANFSKKPPSLTIHNTVQQQKVSHQKIPQHLVTGYHDNNRKQHVSHQVYNEKSFQMMTPIKSSNSIVSVPSFKQHHFLKQKVGNMHTLMVPSQMPITQPQPNAVHTKQS